MNARRGSLLVEVAMAVTLVAVALIAVAQLLAIAARQECAAERRRLALREAANALEYVLATPWGSLSVESFRRRNGAEGISPRLPEGQLEWELRDLAGPPVGKGITARVTWQGPVGREHVQLTAWRFEPPRGEP